MIRALPRDPWGRDLKGQLHRLTFESTVLRDNPLGDPSSRPLLVYTPPGFPAAGPYPAIWCLQSFSSQVDMWTNRSAFEPTWVERVDAAMAGGSLPPALVVMPDLSSSYGGTQFLDSLGVGRYATYLCDELVAFVDQRFPTVAEAGGRALLGKSSGGYGALKLALDRPDVWGGFAAFAPDAGFEYAYLPDFPVAWRTLRNFRGSAEAFWTTVRQKDRLSGDDFATLNSIAMAACYSPGPTGEPELPWDARSGALRPEVWERWLAFDPVRFLPTRLDAARRLRALSLECGIRDEYRLYVGAAQLHGQLDDAQVAHRFEFFDGGHGAMQHRYPAAMAYLLDRLLPRSGAA
jgi:hypothetical protein